jgi:glycine dehydrogenase subunit 2
MKKETRQLRENYHAAQWQEPIIMEMGSPGERGVYVPEVEEEIRRAVGDVLANIPEEMRRREPPALPEISQPHVLRHYLRLSQETLGTDVNIDLGLGTCTMKYSPKVNEALARKEQMADIHPLQAEETLQGILEIVYRFSRILGEISGMDAFSFQPGGGAPAVFTNASIIRAYHEANGEGDVRDEIITTIFSHPANAATPATAGYKLVTLYPDENGYADLQALKAAVSERTAGLMITNPEDTGIFNPRIKEYTDAVRAVGGVCSIDQANANGILGIVRARDLGFDLCHFNLHKTFSSPHGSEGPGCGAVGVREPFAKFLPVPVVEFDGSKYTLNDDMPSSIGKVRAFLGNLQVVLRAYAWVMSLGPDGIRAAAETAVLNNNYLAKRLGRIRGVSIPYAEGKFRLQEVRYSWETLKEETGLGTMDVNHRIVDFGVNNYFSSHEPWVVPEPFTLEPAESYSKADLDEYVAIIERVSEEAYSNPDVIRSAPHRTPIGRMDESVLHDPEKVVVTWRAWLRKQGRRP